MNQYGLLISKHVYSIKDLNRKGENFQYNSQDNAWKMKVCHIKMKVSKSP